jgi:hypothetical protein
MKLKGISPLEQNVDRIILGVVLLVLVGAVALQFLGSGNMVKVGTAQPQPAAQAMVPVENEAKELVRRLDAASPKIPDAPKFTLADKLVIGAATPKLAKSPRALGPAPTISNVSKSQPVDATYGAMTVPAPTGVVTHVTQSTISPVELIRIPDLAKLVPSVQPFDKAAVSIEASFNGTALREELAKDPDGDGPMQPMPSTWWHDQVNGQNIDLVDIVAVQVERETVKQADGTTPAQSVSTMLPVPPGRVAMLTEWNDSVHAVGDMPQMLERMRIAAEDIQRPKYYETIAGPQWMPPTEAEALGGNLGKAGQINRLRNELGNLDKDITRVQGLYDKAPAPSSKDKQPPPSPQQSGGSKGGRGGPIGPTPPGSTQKPEPHGDKVALEQRLNALKAERDKVAKKLADLGEKVPGYDTAPGAAPAAAPAVLSTLENPNVKIWTHDMTAEPGATYRYRIRVVLNNPLFGRNLQQAQAALATNSLIEGPWSDWTEPREVDRPNYFFITAADEGNAGLSPLPSASAELFSFYYGYYRVANVHLEPGDPLVGMTQKLPDLKLANMEKLKAALEDPNQQQPQGGAPGAPPAPPMPPGGEGGGGRRGLVPPGRDERGKVPTPSAPGAPAAPTAPVGPDWLSEPAKKELALAVDAMFLDVTALPTTTTDIAGAKTRLEVMLRDASGNILVKMPDVDKSGDVYKRVLASSKDGETQGQVTAKPIEPPPAAPRAPAPRPAAPAPRPPGGGGGGGGG